MTTCRTIVTRAATVNTGAPGYQKRPLSERVSSQLRGRTVERSRVRWTRGQEHNPCLRPGRIDHLPGKPPPHLAHPTTLIADSPVVRQIPTV
jgi:hypothetical protein